MTDAEWTQWADLCVNHGDMTAPENIAIIHLVQEWAELDILEHQGRLRDERAPRLDWGTDE
jgi:hypothetical protein